MTLDLPTLDEDSAKEAIAAVAELAAESGIAWALAGGLAMILYGSDRLTKDVDIVAERILPKKFKVDGVLRQGGQRYSIETTNA